MHRSEPLAVLVVASAQVDGDFAGGDGEGLVVCGIACGRKGLRGQRVVVCVCQLGFELFGAGSCFGDFW